MIEDAPTAAAKQTDTARTCLMFKLLKNTKSWEIGRKLNLPRLIVYTSNIYLDQIQQAQHLFVGFLSTLILILTTTVAICTLVRRMVIYTRPRATAAIKMIPFMLLKYMVHG